MAAKRPPVKPTSPRQGRGMGTGMRRTTSPLQASRRSLIKKGKTSMGEAARTGRRNTSSVPATRYRQDDQGNDYLPIGAQGEAARLSQPYGAPMSWRKKQGGSARAILPMKRAAVKKASGKKK